MLLELLLDFHAWSAARPAYQSDSTADSLEKEVKVLMETEREQGRYPRAQSTSPSTSSASPSLVGRRTSKLLLTVGIKPRWTRRLIPFSVSTEKTRQRLNDFITRIKLALAALTGLAP